MDETLVRFGTLLRARGIRLSPPETIDAARALLGIDVRRRDQVKLALRATMIKDERDGALFEELFEAFFTISPLPSARDGEDAEELDNGSASGDQAAADLPELDPDLSADQAIAELGQFFDDDEDVLEKRNHGNEDGAMPGRGSEELIIGEGDGEDDGSPEHVLHLDRVSDPGEPGAFNFDPGTELDAEKLASGVHAHHLPEDSVFEEEELEALRRALTGGIENLDELLRRHLEKLKALEAPEQPALDPLVAKHARFTEEEHRRMEALLTRTARELRGALSPRREPAPRGRLNSSRTIRDSFRTGGLPFRPVMMARKEDRPRLAVIVDVSLSVRHTARFTLHLTSGLQAMFGKVRTFAFVADLVEVTDLFRRHELETALAMLFGGDVLDVDTNSDYGHALTTFHDEFLGAVDRRTTLVILGDGRGNGNPAEAWALERIAQRARDVVWLTPEHERYWFLGRSDMERYAEFCDRIEVVRDLDALEEIAGNVLMPRGHSEPRRHWTGHGTEGKKPVEPHQWMQAGYGS